MTALIASESAAKDRATQEAADQRATTDFLFDVFGAGDPLFSKVVSRYGVTTGGDTSVSDMILIAARAEAKDETTAFPDRPLLRAKMLAGLGEMAFSCGDISAAKDAIDLALKLIPNTQEHRFDRAKVTVSSALLDFGFGDMRAAEKKLDAAAPILAEAQRIVPYDKYAQRKYRDIPLVLGMVYLELDRLKRFSGTVRVDEQEIRQRARSKASKNRRASFCLGRGA